MGAWIALNQFKYFKSQIKGFVGIGSAPEFLTRLMWNKFPKKTKTELLKTEKILIKNGGYEYPITLQLINDGRKNKVLHNLNIRSNGIGETGVHMLAQELRRNRHLSTIEMSHNNASPEAMYEVSKLVHRNEDRKKKKKIHYLILMVWGLVWEDLVMR